MDDATTPAWVVTQQVEATDLRPDGTYGPGVRVSFRLASGTLGSVFLPAESYSLAGARAAIADKAATLMAVNELTG